MKRTLLALVFASATIGVPHARAEVSEVTLTRGDGVGFLPLMVMEKLKLIEKKAGEVGLKVNASG